MVAEEADGVNNVLDGLPLIKAATDLKEQGNDKVRKKAYSEAAALYEKGIAILDKADGHPMLRGEVEQMIALKSVLYANVAQCMLSQELWRRAVEAASASLSLDAENVKALHRRSMANEALRRYQSALHDTESLKRLGGGTLSAEAIEARLAVLQEKIDEVQREKDAESSEDEGDNKLLRMKARFDEVVEKYDLTDGDAAAEVADWLTSGEWLMTTQRVAQRWNMEPEDAEDFLKWISKGLEFKMENAGAREQMAGQTPHLGAEADHVH